MFIICVEASTWPLCRCNQLVFMIQLALIVIDLRNAICHYGTALIEMVCITAVVSLHAPPMYGGPWSVSYINMQSK